MSLNKIIAVTLLLVVVSLGIVESVSYKWNGVCELWTPTSPSICWEPHGYPGIHDSIYVPENVNLTIYCPSTFSGSSNSFYTAVYSYGPTCVYSVGSFVVGSAGIFQVSTYLAVTIAKTSSVEFNGTAVLWGSLAAIDGPGDLHVSGRLEVYGGNVQGTGNLFIDIPGVLIFEYYPYEALDCYLLRPNVTVSGTLTFQQPTMLGFWWQNVSVPFQITVFGLVEFNSYVFEYEYEVYIQVAQGGELVGSYLFGDSDLFISSVTNYGTIDSYLSITEFENYGYADEIRSTSILNYGEISYIENYYYSGDIVNFGNILYSSSVNEVTNHGNITLDYVENLYNYGNATVYAGENLTNYGNITLYCESEIYYSCSYVYNEGILDALNGVETVINTGLIRTSPDNYYGNAYNLTNYGVMYCLQDMNILYLTDVDGILYANTANMELQPLYWFWIRNYPTNPYPELPPYGPEENRPTLLGEWYVPVSLSKTSLTGNGTFQFNAPGVINDDLFIDTTLNIEVWAVNYTNPDLVRYCFDVNGNITVSADGMLNAIANIFTQSDNYYIHNFGVVGMHFVFTNLTIVTHPQGNTIVEEFLHVLAASGFNNSVQLFGKMTIKAKMISESNIVLHKGSQIILEKGSTLSVIDGAFIEDCGGSIQNNGGDLNATIEPCSTQHTYAHYAHEIENVIMRKERIAQRLAAYGL